MDQSWSRARRLIVENVVASVAIAVTVIASAVFGSFDLLLVALALALGAAGLGIVNVVAVFRLWRTCRWWTVVPLATYFCCAAAAAVGTPYVIRASLAGTPRRPDTFPRGEAKVDLEHIATQLLGHSIKSISLRSDESPPVMVDGAPPVTVPSSLLRRLRSYGFEHISVDDTQSLVTFSSYGGFRSWYSYLYTTRALDALYSGQSTITDVGIETWAELSNIARQGPEASEVARRHIVFEPSVVYPYLRQELGEEMLNALAQDGASGITPVQKAQVLNALNNQRLASSRLLEHPSITYTDEERFHLSIGPGRRLSDEFWVVKLLQNLLRNGTVERTENNHLRIKADLSEIEERQIEWLHVGLMNFLYGNLLAKQDHRYGMDLGDGWYFDRD